MKNIDNFYKSSSSVFIESNQLILCFKTPLGRELKIVQNGFKNVSTSRHNDMLSGTK